MNPIDSFSSALLPLSGTPFDPGVTLESGARPSARELARQVETMFLGLLLKEMRQTLDEEGGLFVGDSADVHGGLFDFYMGKHLADAGGVGLAQSLTAQLEQTIHPEQPHDAPATRSTRMSLPRSPGS